MLPQNPDKLYGLIGYPLGHSFSQNYFNQKFESEHISAKYINFEIPDIGDLMEVVSEYPTLDGLNVTRPYKELIIPYMDEMDEMAAKIGAVNVVKFIRNGNSFKLKGYNSDIVGFADSLRPLMNADRKKALILGTGGASKAVMQGLLNLGIDAVKVSRKRRDGVLIYDDLTQEVINTHGIIINTTPVGMYPAVNECPPIPYQYLTSKHLCYDLIYNPDTTLFMKRAEEFGAETKNGLEMLLLQAFESWRIWNSDVM